MATGAWVSSSIAMPMGQAPNMIDNAVMISLPKNHSLTILVSTRLNSVPPTPVSRRPV